MIGEQLTSEQQKTAYTFARLKGDVELWDELKRLIRRLHDAGIEDWTNDDTGKRTKKWLQGYRDALAAVIPAIEEGARNAEAMEKEDEEAQGLVTSEAADGMGSGDLAIG